MVSLINVEFREVGERSIHPCTVGPRNTGVIGPIVVRSEELPDERAARNDGGQGVVNSFVDVATREWQRELGVDEVGLREVHLVELPDGDVEPIPMVLWCRFFKKE
jgi:hypothetical protein